MHLSFEKASHLLKRQCSLKQYCAYQVHLLFCRSCRKIFRMVAEDEEYCLKIRGLFHNKKEDAMNIREMLLRYFEEYDYPDPTVENGALVTSERGSKYDFPLQFELNIPLNSFTLWVDILTLPADESVSDALQDALELVNAELSQGGFVENGTGILLSISPDYVPLSLDSIDEIVNRAVNLAEDYLPLFNAVQHKKVTPAEALATLKQELALRQ